MESNFRLQESKLMCCLEEGEMTNDLNDYRSGRDERKRHSGTDSDSSVEMSAVAEPDDTEDGLPAHDSGIADKTAIDADLLLVLEQKIDRLSNLFLEQSTLLISLKEELRSSKVAMENAEATQSEILTDLVNKAVLQSGVKELSSEDELATNSAAKSLLHAIEIRQGSSADMEIRDALSHFLQSEELRNHMVAATAESVKDVIGDCISRDMSSLYLPILEHSHRRLVRSVVNTVEEAFIDLEEKSVNLSKSVHRITRTLRASIDRHNNLLTAATDPQRNLVSTLKCTVEELLHNELKQWRQKVLDLFSPHVQPKAFEDFPDPPRSPHISEGYTPVSSPESAGPNCSIIDKLMTAAEISKQIAEGEVNAAFERALSAADLYLVMEACRRAAPGSVFAPRCRLRPHVLLALVQQLSTDMLHETQLKCRYIEDSIMNLDPSNPVTQAHLPLVVGEVRTHLGNFLSSYPNHVAYRRIALIIMAADNLLK